jgi:CMP-N-acetylneuraminic acid synthetase
MLLQITSPFRPPSLLRDGLARIAADAGAHALIGVKPLPLKLNHIYGSDGIHLSRASQSDGAGCMPSGALYIVRPAALRRYGSFVPPNCLWISHDGFGALDIDTEDDWMIAQAALAAGRISLPQ